MKKVLFRVETTNWLITASATLKSASHWYVNTSKFVFQRYCATKSVTQIVVCNCDLKSTRRRYEISQRKKIKRPQMACHSHLIFPATFVVPSCVTLRLISFSVLLLKAGRVRRGIIFFCFLRFATAFQVVDVTREITFRKSPRLKIITLRVTRQFAYV